MNNLDQSWEKLSQVAIKGAEYDSRERQPHPKCLPGTRVNFLSHINGLLDDGQDGSRIIWVHGTAGVGKSAVAFTVADTMRDPEERPDAKRLAGTFFFSRKYTNRCTTGYFFATLAYQLASNFPSIQGEVSEAVNKNPSLLDPDKSLRDQMEALFLRPLRRLRPRLLECPPLVFVVDALDECTSEAEIVDLITLLGKALRSSDMPVTHILLTSRLEAHIREGMQNEGVRQLVREIPVKTSGEGITSIISLDGADVDSDIYTFLQHSFTTLRSRYPNFPQPTPHELQRLASRAGRRFIVASTMIKFIDDGYNDPHGRLQLMLELTSKLLPGTEVFVLYDRILSTCADPERVYLHLSVVATLANPLPTAQISELLGPGEGRDVEKSLVQLRSVMDVPTDPDLPVSIHHSSVRDYVSNPSHCGLLREQCTTPHALLARSSFRLMMHNIPENTGLLDALLDLKKHSQAMESHDPQSLTGLIDTIVKGVTPLRALTALLWLRGDRSPRLRSWLNTPDGKIWLDTPGGQDWLRDLGRDWLKTQGGRDWLESDGRYWSDGNSPNAGNWLWTERGLDWVDSYGDMRWLWLSGVRDWLDSPEGQDWLSSDASYLGDNADGIDWLDSTDGLDWLDSPSGRKWLQSSNGKVYLESPSGMHWLQSLSFADWLQIMSSVFEASETNQPSPDLQEVDLYIWLESPEGKVWLQNPCGSRWLPTLGGRDWLPTLIGREWLETQDGKHWLHTNSGKNWLQTESAREWLQTESAHTWLDAESEREWLQTKSGKEWLKSKGGHRWLETKNGREWLKIWNGREWLNTESGKEWLETEGAQEWLKTESGRAWRENEDSSEWLDPGGQAWLDTSGGQEWLGTNAGRAWLETGGYSSSRWLDNQSGHRWLQTRGGQEWLDTENARRSHVPWNWLGTDSGEEWLQSEGGDRWLRSSGGVRWLEECYGLAWLGTQNGKQWLKSVRDRLQTPEGQRCSIAETSTWFIMQEFLDTVQAITEFTIIPSFSLIPAFRAIQQFRSLPDFLMFPAFLALIPQCRNSDQSEKISGMDNQIIHAVKAFVSSTDEAWKRSQSSSDALSYACQNWAMHLSQALNPWDDELDYLFKGFWDNHLLSWLERFWCLKGLRFCLPVLSEAQTVVVKKHLRIPELSETFESDPMQDVIAH